ncbi:MAG: ABC transporter ATP-binding protein [Acidimicrobiales bacterium]
MSDLAIETKALTKNFGALVAVDRIDLAIPEGAVSGFVGPNGAGKTTTMRMLLGLIRPSSGGGAVLGQALSAPERFLARVGAMIEGPAFYAPLSGRANLSALARLGQIPSRRVEEVLALVNLTDRAGDAVREYSHGMRQRLGIAAALLPDPSLLVLDEPTNGLDPAGIAGMRNLLLSVAARGVTVFVSSHLLAEVEQICHHVVIIESGRVGFQGPIDALVAAQSPELLVRAERREDLPRLAAKLAESNRPTRMEGEWLHVSAPEEYAAELNRLAAAIGITLVHLSTRRASLEEAFFAHTGEARSLARPKDAAR